MKLASQQLTFENGIFQNIKASNFNRSFNMLLEFVNKGHQYDKISTFMISDSSFNFDNLLILVIYVFRLLLSLKKC